jgi:hypothetical protein
MNACGSAFMHWKYVRAYYSKRVAQRQCVMIGKGGKGFQAVSHISTVPLCSIISFIWSMYLQAHLQLSSSSYFYSHRATGHLQHCAYVGTRDHIVVIKQQNLKVA